MVLNNETVDGKEPQDEKIELLDGMLDPTSEEAQRALAQINGELPADTLPNTEETKTAPVPTQFVDDTRNNIAANFRANRGKTAESVEPLDIAGLDPATDPNGDAMRYGTEIARQNAPAAAVPATEEPAPAKPTVKVKIDGIERDIDQDELVANYQKNQAADARLQEATRLLNEARTVKPIQAHGEEPQREVPASTAQPERPSTPAARIDKDKVAKFVESVQLGTTEEAAQAVTDLLTSVAPQQNSLDIRGAVREVIASDRIQLSSEEATDKFIAKYPAIAQDGILQKVTGEVVSQEMAKDLIAAGLDAATIAKTLPTPAHIRAAHDFLRVRNPTFGRPLAKLYEAAEQSTHFQALTGSKPAPAVQVNLPNRGERKVMVQPQPAHRTPAPLAGQQPQLTREQRMAANIAQMQKDRGQTVVT